eukprot:TRINITY_DN991_c0_g1_i1.p1 TRINITY_DN991_c0_g1~~TRINITY_DN991_c0_g1_i1.p1  ORF type:complete len:251 (+),score=46.47 TRINITY_DN991_c0_g1_i1:67-753(+)
MGNPDSFGVFISPSAVEKQGKEDLHRLTYRTTSGTAFSGRQIAREDRPESYEEVLAVGHRTTKYMGYPLKLAPLLDRTACKYSQEFDRKPLGDSIGNNEMAKNFKLGKGGATRSKSAAALDGRTSYGEDFGTFHTGEGLARAKQPLQLKDGANFAGQKLLFTTSMSHDLFKAHPELGKGFSAKDLKPKDYLGVPRTAPADPMRSLYGVEFVPKEIRRKKGDRRRAGPP